MRNRSLWILAATLPWLALSLPARWPGLEGAGSCGAVGVALAQEVMKFEPVPEESVAATERRRAERIAREAERRDAERRPAAAPTIPSAPDVPAAPELSHASDIVRIGSDIHVPKGQVVDGDVFALRGDIRVDGHVRGNVAATGGDVFLGATARVDGDVMCIGGKLEEEEGARVGGQRVTALRGNGRNDRIDRIDRIAGHPDRDWGPDHDYGDVSFALSWFIVSLLLAWAIAKFAPGRTAITLGVLRRDPGLSLMVGLGLVVLLVPSVVALALVVAILCITIIGIPLALGALVAYAGILVVLALWGYVVGVIPIGEQFGKRLDRPGSLVSSAVLGVAVVSGLRVASELLHFVPLFGWFGKLLWVVAFLLAAVATLMGAGALLRTKFGQGPEGRWWPLWAPAKPSGPAPPAGAPDQGGSPPPPPPSAPAGGSGEPSPVT